LRRFFPSRRLRRGRRFLSVLRQQGSAAAVVHNCHHHLQEKCVTRPRRKAHMRLTTFPSAPSGSTVLRPIMTSSLIAAEPANGRKDRPSNLVALPATAFNKGYGSFEVTLAFSIWLYSTGFFGPIRAQFNANLLQVARGRSAPEDG